MLLFFFIGSVLLSASILLSPGRLVTRVLSLVFSALLIALTVYAWIHQGKTELAYFTFDSTAVLLLSVLALLTVPTLYHGFKYTRRDNLKTYNIYHSALTALITFMAGAYLANTMTVLWIFVEATTLAVAVLIYHDRTEIALEATWKYIFICSTGIALAYLGILFLGFIYGTGEAPNLSFSSFSLVIAGADPLYLKIAFVFVVVGFSTKMGLFPMHTVTIDAHSVAPPPVSALISTALMNVGFLAIFRIYTLFSTTSILPFMNHVLVLAGVMSLLIAAGYMLKAKHLKRMLAYSSFENMGLVAIALGIGGNGYYAALLLIVLHSLAKSSLFYQMGQLSEILHTFRLDETGRYLQLYPAGGTVLITGMITILAIPPSGMFIPELMIFNTMVINGQWFVLVLSLILLTFVVYAMSTRIMHISFSSPRNCRDIRLPGTVNPAETISQFILLGMVIMICFYQPPFLAELIGKSVALLPK
ncbi:MAG TPA: proton-conducting transporter membrane subunit [Bacteroidales bacterium]|jgi:hydrogenase-4 component F|nr:proton-conducting transporter membrane subunit [Bacteroidales bacterium]HQH25115.1 proton-conducting transporter membrane subunit [Bacteroidales bacterium]HQJ83197.1 proton-conducting transporter membrane subunit [Bacteroidales bacterium]